MPGCNNCHPGKQSDSVRYSGLNTGKPEVNFPMADDRRTGLGYDHKTLTVQLDRTINRRESSFMESGSGKYFSERWL